MASAPSGNGNGSRRQTATWAIGAAAAGVVTSFAAAVGVIQEPLERDLASVNRRLDEAILAANRARDELREQFRLEVVDSLARGEERRLATVTQQGQINSAYGSALGDMASRISRIEQDRARILETALARVQRIEDHVNVLDQRLVQIEENFVRVLRGDATQPDRFGGRSNPSP
jgi:hypothetical protein